MNTRIYILYASLLFIFACNNSYPQQMRNAFPAKPLREIIDSLNADESKIEIHIDKSEYSLKLIADGIELKSYPVVFGSNPHADKIREGDKCTPEGEFKIRAKYPHKSWSKFIWIDYPTNDSWKKHNEAKANNIIPASAQIGSEIGIHGVPDNHNEWIDVINNWTLGCISLKNNDVDEIYEFVKVGTQIFIVK